MRRITHCAFGFAVRLDGKTILSFNAERDKIFAVVEDNYIKMEKNGDVAWSTLFNVQWLKFEEEETCGQGTSDTGTQGSSKKSSYKRRPSISSIPSTKEVP